MSNHDTFDVKTSLLKITKHFQIIKKLTLYIVLSMLLYTVKTWQLKTASHLTPLMSKPRNTKINKLIITRQSWHFDSLCGKQFDSCHDNHRPSFFLDNQDGRLDNNLKESRCHDYSQNSCAVTVKKFKLLKSRSM